MDAFQNEQNVYIREAGQKMRIQLSITRDYCPDWGIVEGVREVVQNYLDALDRLGKDSGSIFHRENRLTFTNYGTTIGPADVGLLGRSNKGPDDRGQFGEGLKIGVLALTRAGLVVTIRSLDRTYTAGIEHSDEFDEEVLMFDCMKKGPAINKVEVTIEGVTASMWTDLRHDFLDLREGPYMAHVTLTGEILLDPEEKGRIYSKGIFVDVWEDLSHGYNFTSSSMRLDRDRKMVNDFDLNWELSRMHGHMLCAEETTPEEFLESLETGSRSTRHAVQFLDPAHKESVVQAFTTKHGKDVLPGDVPEGFKSVTVPKQLEQVLAEHKKERIAGAAYEVDFAIEFDELEVPQKEVMDSVLFFLEHALGSTRVEIPTIVRFNNEKTRFDNRLGEGLLVSDRMLETPGRFLQVMVEGSSVPAWEAWPRLVCAAKGWTL